MTAGPNTDGFRARLYGRLHGSPTPLLISRDDIWTAASLWAGSRRWVHHFRAAGLAPGDRVACALPAGAAFVQLLVACMMEQLTLAIVSPRDVTATGANALLAALDARLLVHASLPDAPWLVRPGAAGWPDGPVPHARAARGLQHADIRLLVSTSGSTEAPRWVALSEANLLAVLDSHRDALRMDGGCVLNVLPWHHVFGLVLGLLAGLLWADEIVLDASGGRDLDELLRLAEVHPVTHLNIVPLLGERLFATERGAALLRALAGGVVGGAPVSRALAARLSSTRLRAGYGQTEASPGIMLGEPGEWSERFIGRAVGCDVRVDDDGVLCFRGPNAFAGLWTDGALSREDAGRWVRTDDLVERLPNGSYRFLGRANERFKLANGRFVQPARFEDAIRRAVPAVTEVILRAGGEGTPEIIVSFDGVASERLVGEVLACVPLAGATVRVVPAGEWRRMPKGEVDRRNALLENGLREVASGSI